MVLEKALFISRRSLLDVPEIADTLVNNEKCGFGRATAVPLLCWPPDVFCFSFEGPEYPSRELSGSIIPASADSRDAEKEGV
jgi:hypothetical protein